MRKFSHRTPTVELSTANERLLLATPNLFHRPQAELMFWSRGQFAGANNTRSDAAVTLSERRTRTTAGCCLWQATIALFR